MTSRIARYLIVFSMVTLIAVSAVAEPVRTVLASSIDEVAAALQENGLTLDVEAVSPALVSALVKAVDPGGRVVSKSDYEAFEAACKGESYTLGIALSRTNGFPVITEIMDQHKAAITNLQVGDIIRDVDGVDARELHVSEFISLIKCTNSAPARLLVQRGEYKTNEVSAARIKGPVPAIALAEELPARLCYLQINGLYPNAGKDIVSAIQGWSEAGRYGLILDLRGAGGKDLDAVRDTASLFSESGTMLFTFRDHADQELSLYKAAAGEQISMPTMVLVDDQTIGAAEVLAAALRRSVSGAMLIGQASAGDMMIREPVPLSSGAILYIAKRKLVVADGTVYRGDHGAEPDVKVVAEGTEDEYEPTVSPQRKKEDDDEKRQNRQLASRVKGDAALRRAVDILRGLEALNIRTVENDS